MRAVLLLTVVLCSAGVVRAEQEAASSSSVAAAQRTRIEAGVTDASLRSPFAVPKAVFEAEVSEDKAKATAKIGLGWGNYATSEFGFTGAFDRNAAISRLTNLRELTPGSSLWVTTTWKRYRVRVDSVALNVVCRQAAWAEGQDAGTFQCAEQDLGTESFATRLAALAATPVERPVCQRFSRAMLTGLEVAAGADLKGTSCDVPIALGEVERKYGERFTKSYQSRYDAALKAGDQTTALDLCNEYRRSEQLPPSSACDPSEFAAQEKAQFSRSWKDRFEKRRAEREAEICDEYRQASGKTPLGTGGCTPTEPNPLFTQSFRSRYAETYEWLGAPMWGFRLDAGRSKFEFLNDALDPQEETHGTYSLSGHLGWLTVNDVLFALQYAEGRTWNGQDATELCRPLPSTDASRCQADVVLGGPTKMRRRQVEAQVKAYMTESTAASLIVTRDLAQKAWGIEAPFYFMKDKEGGLAGGLVLTFRHEKDRGAEYAVSVFVGQVFDVF